jgi:hypothetical protein
MRTAAQLRFRPRGLRVLRNFPAIALALILHVAFPAGAAVGSGVYQTVPGAMVLEKGDHVTNGSRFVPLFATVRLDFHPGQPSLIGVITNAVQEGVGAPFALTVTNFLAYPVTNGDYSFHGYYVPGSQVVFDWRFSTSTNGGVVWNGTTYCACGHIWYITITNVAMVPVPWLETARAGPASVGISWSTNLADCVLESTARLSTPGWGTVTNVPSIASDRFSVTLDLDSSNRFFRLRKP